MISAWRGGRAPTLYVVSRAGTGRRVITLTPQPGDLVRDSKAPSGWRRWS